MTANSIHALALLLGGLLLKGTLLLLAAGGICRMIQRRSSAATRHLIWSAALGGVLVLPLLALTVPHWDIAWGTVARVSPTVSGAPTARIAPVARPIQLPLAQVKAHRILPPVIVPHVIRIGGRGGNLSVTQKSTESDVVTPITRDPATAVRQLHPYPIALLLALVGLGVWLIGVIAILAQIGVGLGRIGRVRRLAVPLDGTALAIAETAGREIGVRRRITFLRATAGHGVAVPVTWGLLRPVILLPAQSSLWSDDCLRAALLHEMAHVQRWDWPTQLMTRLACALCWWHPLVWGAARQARAECERACDDCVLQAGVRPADYAQRLVEVVRSMPLGAPSRTVAIAMAQPSEVEERLQAVLARGQARTPVTRRRVIAMAAALIVLLLPLAALHLVAQAQKISHSSPVSWTKEFRRAQDIHSLSQANDTNQEPLVPVTAGRADFPGGVTVSISGVSAPAAPDQPWWDASGAPLSAAPCVWPTEPPQFVPHPSSGETVRNIALGIDNPTSGRVDVRWEFLPTASNVAMQVGRFIQGKGWYAIQATLPQAQDQCDLHVGVASGAWETVATYQPDAVGTTGLQKDATLPSWRIITGEDSDTSLLQFGATHFASAVMMTNRWTTRSQRVVAVDRAGRLHTGQQWSPDMSDGIQTTKASFDLSPAQITAFRLQTRPFRWAEFRDIPLSPRPAQEQRAVSRARIHGTLSAIADALKVTDLALSSPRLAPSDPPTLAIAPRATPTLKALSNTPVMAPKPARPIESPALRGSQVIVTLADTPPPTAPVPPTLPQDPNVTRPHIMEPYILIMPPGALHRLLTLPAAPRPRLGQSQDTVPLIAGKAIAVPLPPTPPLTPEASPAALPSVSDLQTDLRRVIAGYRAGINSEEDVRNATIALAQARISAAIARDQLTDIGPDLETVVGERQQLLEETRARYQAGITSAGDVNAAEATLAEARSCEDLYAVVVARQKALDLVTALYRNGAASDTEKSRADAALQKAQRFFLENINND